ncbi:AAA family ATPase [Herbiconiux sp. SYSU D00978]|uniref:AAA family ATPase n=1 Tax=Herbiconiux sp. SYSU D00978 TaxID=2812562 RepID=UPI001A973A4E|nr:regulator [Herbiconiux sp. SYSU D00978]
MARVLLALPSWLAERHAAEAARHGHLVLARLGDADTAAAAIVDLAPDLLVIAAEPELLNDRVLAACDLVGTRPLALAADDRGRRLAGGLGIREIHDADSDWSELDAAAFGAPLSPERPSGRSGSVVAVWGPPGAPGRTSVAIGVAAELATAGHRVVLADADTHGASIAPALGLLDESPGFAAACRLVDAGGLDHAELERVSQRYESARGDFEVLTGIGRPSRWPELGAERVAGVLRQTRTWADWTVVDVASSLESDEEISSDVFAPRRNAATLAALRDADAVLAVGAADPVGLSRFLRAHVDLVDLVEPERITVVMNRVRASAIGLNPHTQVTRTLSRFAGIAEAVLLPSDPAGFDAALLAGRTLLDVAPRSPVRVPLQRLVAERLAPPAAAPRRSRGLLGRRAAVPAV